MKFNREPTGRYRSMMGDGPEELARVATECGCAAAGSNCGKGIADMVPLAAELAGLTELPVLIEPNAGLPVLKDGRTSYPEDAEFFARRLPALRQAGAHIIGGCCGTTAEHIRAIRQFADSV